MMESKTHRFEEGRMRYALIHFFLFLCALMMFATVASAQEKMTIQSGTPDGFEALEAPRPTSVTLYHGGDIVGAFPAHFAPGMLSFDTPANVVKAIPNISDAAAVTAALSRQLPANTNKLCTAKRTEDCGILTPEVAGVIFNENNLEAELFIHADYLLVKDASSPRYLPLPEKHFSSIYGFSGAVSGVDANTPNFALSNNSTFSFGEATLDTESTLSDDGLRFDTAAATIEKEGIRKTAGLFRSRSMQLIADRDMAGVSYSTSVRTHMDENKTEGNDVIVYLPRRSFVSIYVEGRLYSSRAYEAGNQKINTAELPDGAYQITLKIQEANGTVREEQRFFAKTQELPAPGKPTYFIQAGVIRETAEDDSALPKLTNVPIIRAGTVRRINDNTGLTVNALVVTDRAAVETGVFWMEGDKRVQATALASTKGDLGVQASYVQTSDKLSIAFDGRQVWMADSPIAGYEDLSGEISQVAMSAAYAVTPEITVGARASYVKQTDMDATLSAGPYGEWRMWQDGESSLAASASIARNNEITEGTVMVSYVKQLGGGYGVSSTAGVGKGGNSSGAFGSARAWRETNAPGEQLLLGAGVSADKDQQILSADANWDNHMGQVQGSVQQVIAKDRNSFNYGGSFAFNAAQLADEIHLGGNQNDRSAVIIETAGDADADMKVYVNGMAKSTVKVNGKQVIYLAPFNVYKIRLAPEKNALLDYDTADRKVTLYPGNVTKLKWDINTFYVVSAKIQTVDGQPLSNAILQESKSQVTTNERGQMQAELSRLKQLTFATLDGGKCKVDLPDVKETNGVLIHAQPLVCQPVVGNTTEIASR